MSLFKSIARKIAPYTVSERHKSFASGLYSKRTFQNVVDRYSFVKKYISDKKVLDIACGTGYGTQLMSKFAKHCTGVDLENSFEYKTNNRLRFVQDDALHYLQNSKLMFDTVVSFETVEHIKNYKKFLTLLWSQVKKNGYLILSTPNYELNLALYGGTYNPWHVKEFTNPELTSLLTQITGTQPAVYFQRPVSRKYPWISFLKTNLPVKSRITPPADNLISIFMIYIVKRIK